MVWEPEVEELRRRAELAARGGTPDRIERQHRLGRLTVRERIDGDYLRKSSVSRFRTAA